MKEALKLALEALELALSDDQPYIVKCGEAITAIKEALAQPEEPVSWGVDWSKDGDIPCAIIIKRLPDGGMEVVAMEYGPPQRPWVGLTDEDKQNLAAAQLGWEELIEAVEAKLKEKNT